MSVMTAVCAQVQASNLLLSSTGLAVHCLFYIWFFFSLFLTFILWSRTWYYATSVSAAHYTIPAQLLAPPSMCCPCQWTPYYTIPTQLLVLPPPPFPAAPVSDGHHIMPFQPSPLFPSQLQLLVVDRLHSLQHSDFSVVILPFVMITEYNLLYNINLTILNSVFVTFI